MLLPFQPAPRPLSSCISLAITISTYPPLTLPAIPVSPNSTVRPSTLSFCSKMIVIICRADRPCCLAILLHQLKPK
uniref:Putative secreted protein n=1 Tax=Anopheles marajoara TaxID=58244 RepID=A0A2M4CCL3_9DIPT